jgi:histidine triad (HIT) family protein
MCEFCKIAAGEKPAHIVFNTTSILGFLDVSPVNPGHVLVIPKRHVPSFHDMPVALYAEVMAAVHMLSKVINTALRPAKVGVLIAGFDIEHTHVHIIPMKSRSDVATKRVFDDVWPSASDQDLNMIAQLLMSVLPKKDI